MKENKTRTIVIVCIVAFILFVVSTSVFGMFFNSNSDIQKNDDKKQSTTVETAKRPSNNKGGVGENGNAEEGDGLNKEADEWANEITDRGLHRPIEQRSASNRAIEIPNRADPRQTKEVSITQVVQESGSAQDSSSTASTSPSDEAKSVAQAEYNVRYLDQQGNTILTQARKGNLNEEIKVTPDDLFADGYELFDAKEKTIVLGESLNEVSFTFGKSRELMSIEEFVKREVNYDYPLVYRDIDFRGRQKDLEDFVIKKIYQGDRTTGVFYGTKDQGEQVRRTMVNGSLQGGYTRYAIDIVPLTPKHIEGDKYAIEIDLRYFEDFDYIKAGEKKVTEFYERYKHLKLSDAEKAKLAYDWVLGNIKLFIPPNSNPEWFYNTKGQRRVHFPSSAMLDGEGVCLTYAMTYARLVERLGLDVRIAQGYFGTQARFIPQAKEMLANPDTTTYRARFFNHSWNLVKVDGNWYHVDPFHEINSLDSMIEDSPYHYFLKSDDFMAHHQITVKAPSRPNRPSPPPRKMDIFKVWNVNRMHPAPESYTGEIHTLSNLTK